MTKCLIERLITYFYYLTDDYVVSLFCHLPDVYRELLEPSLINRVLILDCPFNKSGGNQEEPDIESSEQPDSNVSKDDSTPGRHQNLTHQSLHCPRIPRQRRSRTMSWFRLVDLNRAYLLPSY